MEVKLLDRPLLIGGQYTESIGDHVLYYNPLGYGGVTLVDQQTQRVLSLCDGKHRVIDIILCLEDRDSKEVLGEINTLGEREVIEISELHHKKLRERNQVRKNISCWMHLTNRCNLACSYCYIHKSPGDMSVKTGIVAIDQIVATCKEHDIRDVSFKFAGGEPLLRFRFLQQLVSYAEQVKGGLRTNYTILTNGVLLTPDIVEHLKTHRIGVGVSLDGLSRVNDASRFDKKGAGSFSQVMQGLQMLKSGNVTPSIMVTISRSNEEHLKEFTEFLLDGGYRFRFSLERDISNGKPGLLKDLLRLVDALHQCYDLMESNLPNEDIMTLHKFGDTVFNRPINRACGAGKNFFSIGHDGQLGVCGLGLANPFGSLFEEGDLIDRLLKANYEMSTSKASDYEECGVCVWRKSCAGGCPLQTVSTFGRINVPSPYCLVYKEIIPRVLKIKGLQMIRDSRATSRKEG